MSVNLLSMEAPQQDSPPPHETPIALTNLNYEKLEQWAKNIDEFYELTPQMPKEFVGLLDILFKCLIEREMFYNVKKQLALLPYWYKASRNDQRLASLLNAINISDKDLVSTFDAAIKSAFLTIYPLTQASPTIQNPQKLNDLPQTLADRINILTVYYKQIDSLNKNICTLTRLSAFKKYLPGSIQEQYFNFFKEKKEPMSTTPHIVFPLKMLEDMYSKAKQQLSCITKQYKQCYDITDGSLKILQQPSKENYEKEENKKQILVITIIGALHGLLKEFPPQCFTQEEINAINEEEQQEVARQQEFLPEIPQQKNRPKRKQAKSKRRRRPNRHVIPSEKMPLSKPIPDSTHTIQHYNNTLQPKGEHIEDMNDTFAIIKRSPYTYYLYNLSTHNSHMAINPTLPEPCYDERVKKWYDDAQQYACSLSPGATPEKINEQIWRHVFPYACLKYFSHFGKLQRWHDKNNIERSTQVFFVEIQKKNFKKEGIFNIGWGIEDNKAYHTYFDELSYYDFLNKLSANRLNECSKEFFEAYYDKNFPKLPSTT